MRVLLATDGSDDAKTAAAWVRHLPLPSDCELLVLTVVSPPLLPAVPDVLSEARAALLAHARRLVDGTASDLLTGRTGTGRVVEGDPRDEIISAAESWGADLIAVGARGLGAVAGFLLGSVSLAVARDGPCPVLVCKGAPRPLREVTVGIDGSAHARQALAWLTHLAPPGSLRVRLIGVVEPQHYPGSAPGVLREALQGAIAAIESERRAALADALAAAARELRARFRGVETVVERGTPADVIVRDAERRESDLIVVGARGLGTVKRLLLGSVSESVLRHAGCPVLAVRPDSAALARDASAGRWPRQRASSAPASRSRPTRWSRPRRPPGSTRP